MKHGITVAVGLLAGVLLVSCATRHGHERERERDRAPRRDPPPSWTQSQKPNDSVSMYRIGTANGEPTAAAAREAAYQDALRQITQAVMIEVRGSAAGNGTTSLPLTGAEVMPGCSYTVQTPFGYDGWVQVSFPLAEKRKVVESLRR